MGLERIFPEVGRGVAAAPFRATTYAVPAFRNVKPRHWALPTAQDLSIDGPARATTTIALAHGGAGMDSPFLNFLAKGLGERGFRVVRIGYPWQGGWTGARFNRRQ